MLAQTLTKTLTCARSTFSVKKQPPRCTSTTAPATAAALPRLSHASSGSAATRRSGEAPSVGSRSGPYDAYGCGAGQRQVVFKFMFKVMVKVAEAVTGVVWV